MIKIIHRVNTVKELATIPRDLGVEIDVRAFGKDLIISHEPHKEGELLADYLKSYKHALVVFNIKEAGIEDEVLQLAKEHDIEQYFLLDVEFPYLYRAARENVRAIAVRYSEDESIEQAKKYQGLVDWIWIDTNTQLPINREVIKTLAKYKTCLVSPDRWGRPQDISKYREKLSALDYELDAVMVGLEHQEQWL
jgi:hypothetical protein